MRSSAFLAVRRVACVATATWGLSRRIASLQVMGIGMRILAVGLSLFVAALRPGVATAQGAHKKSAPAKKTAAPKPNPVTAAYAAMPLADKIAIQTDLMWTGDFNGAAN